MNALTLDVEQFYNDPGAGRPACTNAKAPYFCRSLPGLSASLIPQGETEAVGGWGVVAREERLFC